jgi:hypothetical protein
MVATIIVSPSHDALTRHTDPWRPQVHDEAVVELAWERMLAFFGSHLKTA